MTARPGGLGPRHELVAAGVRDLRRAIGLSQAQLAALLGVHPLTVSRWERGTLFPTRWHVAILEACAEGARDETARRRARQALDEGDVAAALGLLLPRPSLVHSSNGGRRPSPAL